MTEVSAAGNSYVESSTIQVRAALIGLLLSSLLGNIIPVIGAMLVVVLFAAYGNAADDAGSGIETRIQ